MLQTIEYPPDISPLATAIYELACDGLSTTYIGKAMRVSHNAVEKDLRKIREKWGKFDRPSNVIDIWCRAVGISAVISINERSMLRDPRVKSRDDAIARIAKHIGRSELYVDAMIYLFREVVVMPARVELGWQEQSAVK